MAQKLALITGYAKDPEFVKVLLLALNNQTCRDFDCYVYATPGCHYFLEDSFIDSLSFPCYHLRLQKNMGFAGNNNYAINTAFKNPDYEYAVLANDDTIPENNWLEELLMTAQTGDKIGAVAPKMVFYQKFVTVSGITSALKKYDRLLGVRFYLNTGFAGSFYPKKFYKKGFFQQEEDEIYPFKWTSDNFTIELPFAAATNSTDYMLRLFVANNAAIKDQSLKIMIGDAMIANIELQPNKLCYELTIPASIIEASAHYIVQNAGGAVKDDNTYEIGFGEIDKGQYDTPREVSLFCGGACILNRKALMATGLFMDGLFSYYEDSDLSMRMQKKGFKILYHPKAVIKHYHTGTSKEWSPFFTYYAFRNKIIFSAKTFGMRAFAAAFFERSKETYTYGKLFAKSRFKNPDHRARLKLNLVILKDALIGIVKFKPKFLPK
ncbi:MAG: hypothetical protein ABJB86_01210 [Bacteroidota bacterium]